MITLLLLAGCRTDCATFDEVVFSDPDGLLDEAGLATLEDALDTFAGAVGVDGVCVDEIVAVSSLEENGHALAGRYSGRKDRIEISAAYPEWYGVILTHELCHGLDGVLEIAAAHPELFDDAHGDPDLDEVIYDTEAYRQEERFADLCEVGPGQPALTLALAELGLANPEDVLMAEEVYTAVDEPAVAVGGVIAWEEPVAVRLPDKREGLRRAVATGGHLIAESRADAPLGEHLGEVLPGEAAWGGTAAMDVGRGYLWILAAIGDTDPLFVTGWGTARPALYRWSAGAVAPVDGPFVPLAGDPDTSMSIQGDRAWWQTWGDGQPVQTGLLTTGEVEPYEASAELALTPPLALLPEGPVGAAYSAAPPWLEWWVFGEDAVWPLAIPRGVSPVGTLADGTVVGRMSWEPDRETWCAATVLRDPAGQWSLPGDTTCHNAGPAVIGGELYQVTVEPDAVMIATASRR